MLGPVFVKGHLSFGIDGHALEYIHQNISIFGVTGLPWKPLNPKEHFGRSVSVTVRVPLHAPLSFRTPAFILREQTLYSEGMGLRFVLDAELKGQLSAYIAKYGFYPTAYVRKYPRIPSQVAIQTYPQRVLVVPDAETSSALDGVASQPMIFDIVNLSPNGVLLMTENQIALSVLPGHRIHMALEPRGWFPVPVRIQGLVCRVTDELNSTSNNLTRYLGVKFVRVDEPNKAAFLDLLKDILERMKTMRRPDSAS